MRSPLRLLYLPWRDHQFRAHVLVKVLLTQGLEFHGAFAQCDALLVRVLGDFGCHVRNR